MSEHASSRGYGLFFRDPGYRGIVVGGMAARIPMAMRALGMVVMVSATTGSYWSAGVAAGLCTSAQALFAPPWARLVRHFGVPAVTVASGVLVAVGSVLVILAAHSAVSILWVYVGAVLLGGVALPVGAVTRGLWTDLLEARDISPAFALEGIQDEVSYVAGPALVVTLDVVLFAGAGIAVAGAAPDRDAHPGAVLRPTRPDPARQRVCRSGAAGRCGAAPTSRGAADRGVPLPRRALRCARRGARRSRR